ncbi:hypothetical protein JCM3774_006773 [Rhodotorula dairenensis]
MFPPYKVGSSDTSVPSSSPFYDDDDSDDTDGGRHQGAGLRSLAQYDDSGVGFGNTMTPATAEAVELTRRLKDLELSTEAQRSFFEFESLLETAHERGRLLLDLTGGQVARHLTESVNGLYERLQDAVLFFEQQQDKLVGPEAERQLAQIDQYVYKIVELKQKGQAEREQLKKEFTACQDEALKQVEALRAKYDQQCRTLQTRLQRL